MIVAAIPTLESLDTLQPLVEALLAEQIDTLLIQDNGHGPDGKAWLAALAIREERVRVIEATGQPIYHMWNAAWDRALGAAHLRNDPNPYLLVVNDDIEIPIGLVAHLRDALDADPALWLVSPDHYLPLSSGAHPTGVRYVHGTFRHGGISGWCWMVKARKRLDGLPPIDEQFEWWCGDDDLAFAVEKAGGKVGIVTGLPLDHSHETTARNHAWTHEARERDVQRWNEKWGDDW